MTNVLNSAALLVDFVQQRPGFEFANYGNVTAYRADMRESTNDRSDFYELFSFAISKIGSEQLSAAIYSQLDKGSRLYIVTGKMHYHTGQYFPTEYRAAACRLLANILWAYVRGNYGFNTGDDIRKYFRRQFSRRICKNYFN